jgi:hypothetical protein
MACLPDPCMPHPRSAGSSRGARRGSLRSLVVAAFAAGALLVQSLVAEGAHAHGVALQTAVDTALSSGAYEQQTLAHIRSTGAQFVRIGLDWNEVAPSTPPAGFDPRNPEDPSYRWERLDRMVSDAVARGLTPYITIVTAPPWGELPRGTGSDKPDPQQLALFAQAIATRYDGSHLGLPWVRYWEVWNEPNVSFFLQPQLEGTTIASVDLYRAMINDFAEAVHHARSDDVVIAGALFPNGLHSSIGTAIAPLRFTRLLLCVSAGPHPHRVCQAQIHADAWSVHPYTTGGPSTLPANLDNLWIENLGSLTTLVRSAQRLGTLVSAQPVQTWVTEFSWNSNPPDPKGVPAALEQRWVAETLYRSWHAGVRVFTWYALRDEQFAVPPQRAGLYFECTQGIACDTTKTVELSFRFPFVAYPSAGRHALIWGRTPLGATGVVEVQWLQGRSWRTLMKLSTDSDGIFTAVHTLPRRASASRALLRAVFLTDPESSPAFSLHHPPDIIVQPLG